MSLVPFGANKELPSDLRSPRTPDSEPRKPSMGHDAPSLNIDEF
jgi:hypothetical protein